MRVHLLFFALYRDLAGAGSMELEVPTGTTAAGLVEVIRSGRGRLRELPPEPVVAVNREYASLGTVLRDGDEVAFLPPVAGG